MAQVLHLLPHPGGGGERQHRLLAGELPQYRHRFAALAGRQELPLALPGLLFRRPFVAKQALAADLVHIDGDSSAIVGARVIAQRPYVITTAGLHLLRRATGFVGRDIQDRLRRSVLGSRATMCTSQAEFVELQELCGATAPLTYVPNAVPLQPLPSSDERATAREALGLLDSEVTALMVTRLESRKHALLAARAATRVREAGTCLTLLIAGDGPDRRQLDKLAGPAVRPLGFCNDVRGLLAAADIFVLVSEREGMSLALLEAMGAGLPAVVSDGAGNPEVVGSEAGAVVPAAEEDPLVARLQELAADPEWRRAAGAAARYRVETVFPMSRMLIGVEDAYRRCL